MQRGDTAPEVRLEIALFASVFIPISLLVFGWSAGRTHWIVPVIGAALYVPGTLSSIFPSFSIFR
jgi:DHA1 family multidrug resistance protein-like MFS transporter